MKSCFFVNVFSSSCEVSLCFDCQRLYMFGFLILFIFIDIFCSFILFVIHMLKFLVIHMLKFHTKTG